MLEELDNLLDALMNIDDKLNELQRINSMVRKEKERWNLRL